MSGTPRTQPLRRWLLLGLLVLGHLPVLAMIPVAVWQFHKPLDLREAAVEDVQKARTHWEDPDWQAGMARTYAGTSVSLELFDGDEVIFATGVDPLAATAGEQHFAIDIIRSPERPELQFRVFGPQRVGPPSAVFWMVLVGVTAFLVLLVASWFYVGKTIVRPLMAAGQAARQVAGGNLDVVLPPSRISEVNELNLAINSMSADLQESLEQQAAMEQDRRLMIGAVVHDLRTPLFSLRGYLAGLESGVADTPEKQRHYFTVAQEKADALERLISDLFDYTRLEYLEETPVRERLELDELLETLVDGMSPQAVAKGVTMHVDVAPECPVAGDRHLLTRAIENLLDNALRHTPSGSTVVTTCLRSGDHVVFSVRDTGPGIPEADLPHLFAPLFRGETSRNRRTGGAGLGLTIARRIIRAHGGELEAANAPEGGAVFNGRLPLFT